MNATLLQLLLIVGQQVGGGLFMIWFFRWRLDKEKQAQQEARTDEKVEAYPSDLMERFQELERIVGSFRERIARLETKTNGVAWKPGGIAGRES